MRRALFILLLLPIAAHAQRVTTRTISLGTTPIPPLGLFAEAEYEWQVSEALGFTAGAAYALRMAGLTYVIADFSGEEYQSYSRLSTIDLSIGASFHSFNANSIYPYGSAGLIIATRIAQQHVRESSPEDVDLVFPMLYLGAGLRQPLGGASYVGLGGQIELAPMKRNSKASNVIVALQWGTTL